MEGKEGTKKMRGLREDGDGDGTRPISSTCLHHLSVSFTASEPDFSCFVVDSTSFHRR